jgi:hypothetical protein
MRNLQGERSGPYPVFTRIAGDAQEMSMKRLVLLAAAAALVVTATPALAKSKKKHRVHHGYYAEQYAPYPGWASRNVSDPSLGYNYGLNRARSTGRCVADLGYGRYEYCGW